MAVKLLLLGEILISCLVLIHSEEYSQRVSFGERRPNPVSQSFQPIHRQTIHRQPIQHRQAIRKQTVRLDTVISKPVETKIIRGESSVKRVAPKPVHTAVRPPPEPVQPARGDSSGYVQPVPQRNVHREYGQPYGADNSQRELEIERRRTTVRQHIPDIDRDRYRDRNREPVPAVNGQAGLEAALFSEPTTPGTEPELVITTVSPTHPTFTTVDAALRRDSQNAFVDEDEDDDDEDEEEDIGDPTDATQVENGVNDRRKDQSPIQTAIDYTKYKPRKRNLRGKKLLRLLSDDYDPDWMSFEEPKELRTTQPVGIAYKTDANLLTALNNLNFTFQSPNGLSFQPPPQLLNVFKDWLIRKAGCPVTFTWHDIGDYYWPRWVKRGECLNDAPCSWPPGQRCVPVRSHTVFILRWHCRRTLPRYLRRGRRFHVRREGTGRDRSRDERRDRPRDPERRDRSRKRRTRVDRRSRAGRQDAYGSNLQSEVRPASSMLTSRIKCRWLKIPYPVIANCFCTCP